MVAAALVFSLGIDSFHLYHVLTHHSAVPPVIHGDLYDPVAASVIGTIESPCHLHIVFQIDDLVGEDLFIDAAVVVSHGDSTYDMCPARIF